jgi:hypothetical protein
MGEIGALDIYAKVNECLGAVAWSHLVGSTGQIVLENKEYGG